ncbi:Short-chain dehydrogenase/reductase SDR [Modestobacter italicus]|uniref:Short-chain dehydrogenase/reductase SDR n=1 Tax=Modestobacter italicus (strain DSM 44449 / CECT 9708 / BC 501) TaxID=2732864 RepID=I4EU27_MODI5|nr:SDR family oxidoreductase [Modestobacter marinus]CCH86890.1 Short-chain dehydrogenase/reductase SDR [Modestobacter marinus]
MDLQVRGKRAFISGSTRGIGYAVARSLAAEGAAVVLHGRTPDGVRAAVRRLQEERHGVEVSGVAGDVADDGQVGRLLEAVGDVDVLVNNVGVFEVKPFAAITDEDWRSVLDVNLMSAVRLSRQLLPGMLERGWGRVVMVSSESGVDVPADMLHYGVSKAAVLALSNGLAKLTRGTEVTVNTVLGGPTYSDGVAGAVRHVAELQQLPEEDVKAAIAAGNTSSLVQRFLEPAELASLVTYLASPLASATNGAALRADGGRLVQVL